MKGSTQLLQEVRVSFFLPQSTQPGMVKFQNGIRKYFSHHNSSLLERESLHYIVRAGSPIDKTWKERMVCGTIITQLDRCQTNSKLSAEGKQTNLAELEGITSGNCHCCYSHYSWHILSSLKKSRRVSLGCCMLASIFSSNWFDLRKKKQQRNFFLLLFFLLSVMALVLRFVSKYLFVCLFVSMDGLFYNWALTLTTFNFVPSFFPVQQCVRVG